MSILIPPIKCQGIKTKIVPDIKDNIKDVSFSRWIEPFMGSGVVAFNVLPERAVLCDTNPFLIEFYQAIKDGLVTPSAVRDFLVSEGEKLLREGEDYYYLVRTRFNQEHSPFDFLFLNRACFNGIMRFNKKGGFNVPFCRKNNRFAKAYITKIVNQVGSVANILSQKDFVFICQDFKSTFKMADESDFIYCDPPYVDRHTDYYNKWAFTDEDDLLFSLRTTSANFVLSTWKGNIYRENIYFEQYKKYFDVIVRDHFYHVGGQIVNRHSMEEALFMNFSPSKIIKESPLQQLCFSYYE